MIAQTSSLRHRRFNRNRRVFPDENIIEGTTKQNKHRRRSKQTNKRARVALDPASILQNFLSHKWRLLLHCFLPSVCKKETCFTQSRSYVIERKYRHLHRIICHYQRQNCTSCKICETSYCLWRGFPRIYTRTTDRSTAPLATALP